MREEAYPRPLTHDLMGAIVNALSDGLVRVEITDLKDHTFYARLILRRGDQEVEVDARPSDSIALAVAAEAPIHCAESVLTKVCKPEAP